MLTRLFALSIVAAFLAGCGESPAQQTPKSRDAARLNHVADVATTYPAATVTITNLSRYAIQHFKHEHEPWSRTAIESLQTMEDAARHTTKCQPYQDYGGTIRYPGCSQIFGAADNLQWTADHL